ncbi:Nitroreductase-like protein [Aspergillus cavernicola]|uniref:Nitroreductase-like protein n=1 Tax=Aspergillus cavernicola TaxID=176166 RepID=A0ABR4IXJ9_9EURO
MTDKSSTILASLANRRSYYTLTPSSPIPDAQIHSILKSIIHLTPSAFNSQTTRIVILLKQSHNQFWDIVKSVLLAKIGPERFPKTEEKLNSFRAAYGTVLFYEDQPTIAALQGQFKSYAQHFEAWSEQTSGMHQLMAWVALEAEGLGANLQHYNPIIDGKVAEAFDVPTEWKLRAQLVFGAPEGGVPAEKEKKPVEEVLKVFGGDT